MRSLATLLLLCFSSLASQAQSYCSPTFLFGCDLWKTLSVSVGDLAWTFNGSDCTQWDYTALNTSILISEALDMTVVSGSWCGCAVWVDLDNNGTFEDSENMYTSYVGGDPSYTYTFPLEIPEGTAPGIYRMRVISPWGSDGFTSGSENGFGPCGSYQYGNFIDFSLEVIASTGVATQGAAPAFSVWPTLTEGLVFVSTDATLPMDQLTVIAMDGRVVRDAHLATAAERSTVDLSDEAAGVYFLRIHSGTTVKTARVVKE